MGRHGGNLVLTIGPSLIFLLIGSLRHLRLPRPEDLEGSSTLAIRPDELSLRFGCWRARRRFCSRKSDALLLNQPLDNKSPLRPTREKGIECVGLDDIPVHLLPAFAVTINVMVTRYCGCFLGSAWQLTELCPESLYALANSTPSSGNRSRAPI